MSTADSVEASSAPQVVTATIDGSVDNDRNAKAFRCQKVFDQALRWIKMAGSSSDRIQPLLKEAYQLALEVHGERDLKTARIGWQLASTLLTSGLTDQAVPLLQSVQKTREALLPDTSDELYDVYADLSYVHMSKAQQSSNREKQAEEFRQAMDLAQKAKTIVKKNANSSTTDRYHSRQCLISSRLGSIHRAQGQHAESVVEFEQALLSSERLAMDQDKNVKLRVHVTLERASAELHRTSMQLAQTKRKSTKLTSSTSTAGATTPTTAVTAADPTPMIPASTTAPRTAADLYSQAINLLKEHHLEEMPFMAQAQAGLALVLMADADTLHQEMLKDKASKKSTTSTAAAPSSQPSSSRASSASPSPTASPTASIAPSLSPSPTPPTSSTASEKTAMIKQLLNQSVQLTIDAMKLYQTIGGEGSHDVATMCYNLGSLYVRLDEVSSARTYLNRSLDLRKKLYGPAHPSVLQVDVDLKKIKSLPDTTPFSARLQRRSTMPSAPNGNTTTNTTATTPTSSAASSPLTSGRRRNFVAATSSGTAAKSSMNPVPPSMPATAAASGSVTSRPTVNRARTSGPLPSSGSQSARGTAVVAARALKASSLKASSEPSANAAVQAPAATASTSTATAATESKPAVTTSVVNATVAAPSMQSVQKPAAAPAAVADSTPVAVAGPISPIAASDSMVVTINPQSATTTTTTTSVVSLTPTLTVVSTEVSTTTAAEIINDTTAATDEKKKPLSRPSSSKTYIIHRSASKGTLPTTSSTAASDSPISTIAAAAANANSSAATTTAIATPIVSVAPTPTVEGTVSATPVVVNPARASGKYILRPKSAIRVLPSSGPVAATPITSHVASSIAPTAHNSIAVASLQSKDDVPDVKSPIEQKIAPSVSLAAAPSKRKVEDEERKESDVTSQTSPPPAASSDVAPPIFNPQFLSF